MGRSELFGSCGVTTRAPVILRLPLSSFHPHCHPERSVRFATRSKHVVEGSLLFSYVLTAATSCTRLNAPIRHQPQGILRLRGPIRKANRSTPLGMTEPSVPNHPTRGTRLHWRFLAPPASRNIGMQRPGANCRRRQQSNPFPEGPEQHMSQSKQRHVDHKATQNPRKQIPP